MKRAMKFKELYLKKWLANKPLGKTVPVHRCPIFKTSTWQYDPSFSDGINICWAAVNVIPKTKLCAEWDSLFFCILSRKKNIESINVLQSAFSECDTVNTRQTHSRNAKIIINGRTQLNSASLYLDEFTLRNKILLQRENNCFRDFFLFTASWIT